VDNAPVAISVEAEPGDHHQILINLQPQSPTWFSRFDRVMEIIYPQPEYEQAKRDNFTFYKDRGYALSFHDLSDKFTQ
jgi:DNA polymerase-3 subunit chi